jgi:two-component system sensor histidine kinase MprB
VQSQQSQRKSVRSSAPRAKKAAGKATRPKNTRMRSVQTALRGMSLRARVSLLVMVAVGITVALASLVSYMVIRDEVVRHVDQDLLQRASLVAESNLVSSPQAFVGPNTADILVASGLKASLITTDGQRYAQYNPQLVQLKINDHTTVIDSSLPSVGQDEVSIAQQGYGSYFHTVGTPEGQYRTVAVPVAFEPGTAIVVGTSLGPTTSTLHALGWVTFLVGLAGIGVAGTAGFAIGRTALKPVEELTVATEYIARTGDLRRIEVTGNDELARLTMSFNTMLAALARSQEYQRRLVADAGHELRTPLTSIRTNLDLLAQAMAEPDNPRLSAQDRTDLMNDARAQMEELSVLISDLVQLSRDEHPMHAIEAVDLAEIVERAVERVQRRAPSLTYDVRLSPWYLQGEPATLERAVTNLLDNAAKWSPPNGTVTITLEEGALQVADQGPGIAEKDMEHVFERFYRSPEARTMPGSGLGLAIVRQVAENHGGRVAVARAPGGGALLGVWLPGLPEPPSTSAEGPAQTAATRSEFLTAPVEVLEQGPKRGGASRDASGDPTGSARTAPGSEAP